MSKVPPPVSLPKPKSVTRASDVKTTEHGRLLQLVWEDLPSVVDEFFGFASSSEALAEAKASAIAKFDEHVGSLSGALKKLESSQEHHDDRLAIKTLCRQLDGLRKAAAGLELPPVKPGVENVVIEAVVTETKGSAWDPITKEIGFVDLSCTVQSRKDLYLSVEETGALSKALRSMTSLFPFSDDADRQAAALLKAYRSNPEPLPPPAWFTLTRDIPLWVDIRATPTPVGQLLRELKTLRGYAPPRTEILVIIDLDGRDPVIEMLNDEGFHVGTTFWLEGLGG